MRLQGTVKVAVTVSETGSVSSTKVVSGHPLLVTAAIDAVKHYRYKPYLADGKAAAFVTTVEGKKLGTARVFSGLLKGSQFKIVDPKKMM